MTPYETYQKDLKHLRDNKQSISLRHEAWRKFVARYVYSHPDLGLREIGKHMGISHARVGEISRAQGFGRGKS